jgi:hypothetical protein
MKYGLDTLLILDGSVEGRNNRSDATRYALRWDSESAFSSLHFRQYITPRKVQMMQMNVPQLSHG